MNEYKEYHDINCDGCGRFITWEVCAIKNTIYSVRCPCTDCLIKTTCSVMCNSRIRLLEEILIIGTNVS
jgi:hypothetical protein